MTDKEYLEAIDKEALRRGYMENGESLTSATGEEPWLEAWHDDPTLTAEDQVSEEIHYAMKSL